MGAFEYTALDPRGREKKGVLEGDTPRHIRAQLREMGLAPLDVSEVSEREAGARRGRIRLQPGISAAELALATRQLATLVRSGLPLEEAIGAVAQQSERPRTKSMLMAVRSRVLEGHTLAYALGEFPRVFPEIFRATVAAGEQSGHLDAVLERLADYTENRQQIRQKVSHALIYPILLTIMAVVIVSGLLVYVVPKVVTVFQNQHQALPKLTVALIAMSDFLRAHGVLLLVVLLGVAFIVHRALRRPGPRRKFHRALLHAPLLGKLVRGFNTARFTRTLSILAGSGVPVLDALRIAGEVVVNIPMREAVETTAHRVREGGSISRSLSASGLFPPMTIHLIASGEQSGELQDMLERAAANQEREIESLIGTMLGLMEPLLILIMGVVVLLIVLAILMPILQMNNLVR